MNEEWRNIEWTLGEYRVSNLGNVMSFAKDVRGVVLKPYRTGKSPGYLTVQIGGLNFKVHRLVAAAFLPNDGERPQVNHINGDTTDNRVQNLEWCTGSENVRHAFGVLGRISSGGHSGKKGAKHHASKRVFAYPPNSQEPLEFGSTAEAARHIGCSSGMVPRVCNGVYRTVKGWRCEYV